MAKRALALFAASVVLIFGAATASPALAMPMPIVPGCSGDTEYCINWHSNALANPPFMEGDWEDNDSPVQYERGFIHCQNGRSFRTPTGGWVKAEELESKAVCAAGYAMVGGGIDIKTCPTCSYQRHWMTGHDPRARVRAWAKSSSPSQLPQLLSS